jgi:hypothetical protein
VTTSGTTRRACIRMPCRLAFAVAVAAATIAAPAAHAQAKPTQPRIGVLTFSAAPAGANPPEENAFCDGLRALGYEEATASRR